MPLTFPAHQAAVLPLKLWRPRWFDGTALVVGAGSPDLFTALTKVAGFDSHHWSGVALAVPFTIIYATVLRRYAASGLFGSVPDFGPLRLRNYRVLANGRPRFLVTLMSAFIGVMSHVVIDSFTHSYRWGANLLGLNDVVLATRLGPITEAKVLQYLGHTVGSLIGIVLFVIVVSRRHLGEWYGTDDVDAARIAPVRPGAAQRARRIMALAVLIGIAWGAAQGAAVIFTIGMCIVLGLLVVGLANTTEVTNAAGPAGVTARTRIGRARLR